MLNLWPPISKALRTVSPSVSGAQIDYFIGEFKHQYHAYKQDFGQNPETIERSIASACYITFVLHPAYDRFKIDDYKYQIIKELNHAMVEVSL